MSSVNKVIQVGNLGKDPEVRSLQNGSKVVNLSIATGESWVDRDSGQRKERTEWHRVVIFNEKLGEIAERYLKKGSKVFLEGQLQTRKWTDQAGVEKFSTEVVLTQFKSTLVLLDSRQNADGAGDRPAARQSTGVDGRAAPRQEQTWDSRSDLDDEIPF